MTRPTLGEVPTAKVCARWQCLCDSPCKTHSKEEKQRMLRACILACNAHESADTCTRNMADPDVWRSLWAIGFCAGLDDAERKMTDDR